MHGTNEEEEEEEGEENEFADTEGRVGSWNLERVVVESLWNQMECRFYEETFEEQRRGGHLSRVFSVR
jgi:hypothetical protein